MSKGKLKIKQTARGFNLIKFEDYYGSECSLQISSLADKDAIWLGIDNANPQIMASKTKEGGNGWVPFAMPEDVLLTTRMHLTREQVEELLPYLQKFVKTGGIK
jgi:hypothetical protein